MSEIVMTENVLFDLDGTLTDPFEGISSSVLYALEKSGRAPLDTETLKTFIGPPLAYSFVDKCGMSRAAADKAVAFYREYYSEYGIFRLKVYDGIEEVLRLLKRDGKKLYMATSKPERSAERIAEKFGFDRYFDGIAGASFDLSRAEKTDVLKYALDRFAIDPKAATMVGDRKFDIEGGKAFGLKTVGVLYGYGTMDELVKAGADRFAVSPRDIYLRKA